MGASSNSKRFIDAIVENPDDEGRWIVYADWLLQQNDPRGELINFELAVERGGIDGDELARRTTAIVRDDEKLLSPRLFAHWHLWDLVWWRGFVRAAEGRPDDDWSSEAISALFADPHAGLLASLDVTGSEDVTAPVFAAPRRHLKKFSLTELGRFADALNDVMPNLEHLALTGGTMAQHTGVPIANITMLAHANLRRLEADQYTCPAATTASLIVPRLEALQWWVMPDDDITGDGSIVHRPPPNLRKLILLDGAMPSGTDVMDAAASIANTALMRQLTSLELGDLGAVALERLCVLAPQLAHLEKLTFGVPYVVVGYEGEDPVEPPVDLEFLARVERHLVTGMPRTTIEFPRESRVIPVVPDLDL